MPSTQFHIARISDSDKYKRLRRKNDEFGSGIDVTYGVLKDDTTEVQSISFDKNKFSASEARKWLKDHDYKPIEFVAATTEKSDNVKLEYKSFRFNLMGAEEKRMNDADYGLIKGYASTFDNVDLGGDTIIRGAFVKSLEKYRQESKKIPMCFQHSMMDIIGGFDPSKMYEDEKGLFFGEGQINLGVTRGRDVYALTKQGVLCETSIGYTVGDYEFETDTITGLINKRILKEINLWEISMVAIPMDPKARITDVKNKNIEEEIITVKNIQSICNKNHLPVKDKKYLLERLLHDQGLLSKSAAKFIAEKFFDEQDLKQNSKIVANIDKKEENKNNSTLASENEAINLLSNIKKNIMDNKIKDELLKLRKVISK